MARYSSLRASEADRDAVAERLRQAAVQGRLEHEELEERLHAALRARTYGELHGLLADLPAQPAPREHRAMDVRPAAYTAIAVMARVLVTMLVLTVVLAVVVMMAAWWLVWALLWFAFWAGRGRSRRGFAAGSAWCGPPRARRVRAGRPTRLV